MILQGSRVHENDHKPLHRDYKLELRSLQLAVFGRYVLQFRDGTGRRIF